MKHIDISNSNIGALISFLDDNKLGQNKFRYFINRDISAIRNHILTRLYYDNNEAVGYGHLDEDSDTIWLGIMVGDSYAGEGYGNKIMDDLISYSNKEIYLAVDKDNRIALDLYRKKGFIIIESTERYYKMVLRK